MNNCEVCRRPIKPEEASIIVAMRKDGGRYISGVRIHKPCASDRRVVHLGGDMRVIAARVGFIRRSR